MPGNIQIKYPASTSTSITCTLASLASDTSLLAGRESTLIDNQTNQDTEHFISGSITMPATTPTAGRVVQVWAYAPERMNAGAAVLPAPFTGVDSSRTALSAFWRDSALRMLWVSAINDVASRAYYMPPTSVAQAFGGFLPPVYGLWVVHSAGVALADGSLYLTRVQNQYT